MIGIMFPAGPYPPTHGSGDQAEVEDWYIIYGDMGACRWSPSYCRDTTNRVPTKT